MVQIGHAKKTNSLRFVSVPWLQAKDDRTGIFGDSHARIITLVRREKKQLAGYVALFIERIVRGKSAWYGISPAVAPEFISDWKFGTSGVEGAAK